MARPSPKLMVLAGVVLLVGAPVVAALAFRSKPGPPTASAQEPEPAPASSPGFPVPPKGGVFYARQLGGEALALGVVPGNGTVLAQASVLSGQGRGVSGLSVSLNGKPAAGCGSGCYRATLVDRPKSVTVHVRTTDWRVALPDAWPPRDGTAIVDRATAAWRALGRARRGRSSLPRGGRAGWSRGLLRQHGSGRRRADQRRVRSLRRRRPESPRPATRGQPSALSPEPDSPREAATVGHSPS